MMIIYLLKDLKECQHLIIFKELIFYNFFQKINLYKLKKVLDYDNKIFEKTKI